MVISILKYAASTIVLEQYSVAPENTYDKM